MSTNRVSIQLGKREDGVFTSFHNVPQVNAFGTSRRIETNNYSVVRITNLGYTEDILFINFGDSTIVADENSIVVLPGTTEYFGTDSHTHMALICLDRNSSLSSSSSTSSESSESSVSSESVSSESISSESSESSTSSESISSESSESSTTI